jgi:lysophospholipase L1-like esterase
VRTRQSLPGAYDVEVTTNNEGLRGPLDVHTEKTAGTTRIAVFGCSQTFGTGVADDETYSAQLARRLPAVEVLNFGVGGYGTDQMLLYYESEGTRFAPDVVILAFAFYHLERNVAAFRYFAKPHFALAPDGTLHLLGTPVPGPDMVAREESFPRPLPIIDQSVLLRWAWKGVLRRQERALYKSDSGAWQLTRALIRRFARAVRTAGAHLVVLNVDHGAPEIDAAMSALTRELQIVFVNAGAALARIESRHLDRLRLRGDPHFNAAGHRVIAETLQEHLGAGGMLRVDSVQ